MTRLRRLLAVFLLVAPLAAGAPVIRHVQAQDCDPASAPCDTGGGDDSGNDTGGGDSCTGNGGSGSDGGGGGCLEPDPESDTDDPTPAPRREPVRPVDPVTPATTSAPQRDTSVASAPKGGTAANQGGPAATDKQLAEWAKHFKTTPEEVKSWFNPYTTNDTIGGEGSGRALHAGDEYTISNHGAVKDGAAAAGFMDMREGNTIEVDLHSTAVRLGSTTTDKQGRFTVRVKIPSNTKLGRHFVVASTSNLKQGTIAFVYPLNVVSAEPVFNGAVTQPTSTRGSSTPWLLIEFVLGTAMIAGLVVFRVRRSAAARI